MEKPARAPSRVAGAPASRDLFARNGVDRFVLQTPSFAHEVWDATTLRAPVTIDHAGGKSTTTGAVSPDGAVVALVGCTEAATAKELYGAPRCGAFYDARTGHLSFAFSAKHDLDDISFTGDSRHLVAKSRDTGLTVFDATTGKIVVTFADWNHQLPVHAHNGPDLAELTGSLLVVGHGETIDAFDLTEKKVVASSRHAGKTLAVYGPKSGRVAVMLGEASTVRVWDIKTKKIIRTFALSKHLPGANCTHCAIEIDDTNEERLWVTPAYNNERFELDIGSGEVKLIDQHSLALQSLPSARHRVREISTPSEQSCALERRDVREAPRPLPPEYCNRSHGPTGAVSHGWPYPGFDPGGALLASIYDGELLVLDVERVTTLGSVGTRAVPRKK